MTAVLDAASLRITRGDVTAEELAAIVVVLNAALAASTSDRRGRATPAEWNAPHRAIRRPLMHAMNAWRRSALPH